MTMTGQGCQTTTTYKLCMAAMWLARGNTVAGTTYRSAAWPAAAAPTRKTHRVTLDLRQECQSGLVASWGPLTSTVQVPLVSATPSVGVAAF
jgi:hypothetical protein